MIRRFLIVLLTALVWSVQTVDAAVCNTENCAQSASSETLPMADGADASSGHEDVDAGCSADCVCHALHHGLVNESQPALAQLAVMSSTYRRADCSVAPFETAPPVRPPLA